MHNLYLTDEKKFQTSVEFSRSIRKAILKLTYLNKASHVGGALSVTDILAVLYQDILKVDPKNPGWERRDRLFYSKGHACTALYAALQEMGFYTKEEMQSFTKNGSCFTSHVSNKIPGIELSTGSLGHALPVACGVAKAGKIKTKPWRVYVIVGDGELNEGSNWEAIMFAPHHKLNNLTLIVDYNKIQSFGNTNEVLNLEPLKSKFDSFGWHTIEVDGHNHENLSDALSLQTNDKPVAVIAHTIKGKGVSFMENTLLWHYKSPSDEEYSLAMEQIDKL